MGQPLTSTKHWQLNGSAEAQCAAFGRCQCTALGRWGAVAGVRNNEKKAWTLIWLVVWNMFVFFHNIWDNPSQLTLHILQRDWNHQPVIFTPLHRRFLQSWGFPSRQPWVTKYGRFWLGWLGAPMASETSIFEYMGVSTNGGSPKWMVYTGTYH